MIYDSLCNFFHDALNQTLPFVSFSRNNKKNMFNR